MDYHARFIQLRKAFIQNRLDALLVTHLPNVRYLCGFTGSAGALLLTGQGSVFFTDGRYTEQAHQEVREARVVIARKPCLIAAAEWLASRPGRLRSKGQCRLGVEAQHLSWDAYRRIKSVLSSHVRVRPAPAFVEAARIIKDSEEIERIRAAAILGASLFERILKVLRPGIREAAIAAEIEYSARMAGAEAMSFPTIVVSGDRSALPHGQPSERPIASGGFVVCDFGVILTGYCSDRTRTVWTGRVTREARRVYQAVDEARQAAITTVRPGRSLGEVDREARKVLQGHGLEKYFTHSTGHGVGLEIHEAPRVAAGEAEVLQPGMVITIEPGAYLPGKWGVRIEDMVLVTDGGCEVLAPSSTELIAL